MILAAGRGERLRPITDRIPKPLVMVGHHKLIEYHIRRLAQQSFDRVVINTSYLGEQIVQAIGDGGHYGIEIVYSSEQNALETGGGIRQALPLLRSDTFLVINGDIYTDHPFSQHVLPDQENIHLVMVENPPHNLQGDFALDNQRLIDHQPHSPKKLTFSGIGYYRRSVFASLKPGKFPLAPIIRSHIQSNTASGEQHLGIWLDVGTKERLARANDIAQRHAGN